MSPICWKPSTEPFKRAVFNFPNTSGTFRYLKKPSQLQTSSLPNTEPQTSGTPNLQQLVLVIPRLQWRIALDVVEVQAIPLPAYHPSPNHAVVFWPQKESPFQLSVYFSCLLAKHWRSHICKTCDITRCASLPREAPSLSNKKFSWQIQLLCRCLCFSQDLVRYLTPSQQNS